MRRIWRIGYAILSVTLLVSISVVAAQRGQDQSQNDNEVADCTWAYKEGYSVDLERGTFEECSQSLLDQITQFALEEGYGYWGEILIYVDYEGNVYFTESDGTNQDDWIFAGTLTPTHPEDAPNADPDDPQEPAVPLTLDEIFQLGVEDLNDFWSGVFQEENIDYERPHIVLFDERSIRSACGRLESAYGPVYCPADHTGYFPRGFMQDQLDTVGDFAVVVIIAHEWGHSIQAQTTLMTDNEYTIDNELQADCFAGAYSQYANVKSVRVLLEDGDIEEGANAIFLVGDPEGTPWFDENAHGTGRQRLAAFTVGLDGDYESCLEPLR